MFDSWYQNEELAVEEDIELILEEANAFGLRWEVESFAQRFMEEDPTLPKIEAYVMAYNEWIK